MIISHKYKFIYIRSQKTASTSLDVFFSAYCDSNDVVTIMLEETPEWHNGNTLVNNHIEAFDVYNFIGEKTFNDYYKFTSIRNPLDKIMSCYFWWRKEPKLAPPLCPPLDYDFNDWVMRYDFRHRAAIFHEPYYKINGRIIVDDYIRYETLEDDLVRICGILGMEYDKKYLLHYKKVPRTDVEITDEAMSKIKDMFSQELLDLNYEI